MGCDVGAMVMQSHFSTPLRIVFGKTVGIDRFVAGNPVKIARILDVVD